MQGSEFGNGTLKDPQLELYSGAFNPLEVCGQHNVHKLVATNKAVPPATFDATSVPTLPAGTDTVVPYFEGPEYGT
jgi:hypothetical protein